jgi:class 3 adenylate cyclase
MEKETTSRKRNNKIFKQIYIARTFDYLLVLACIISAKEVMDINNVTFGIMCFLLLVVPHVVYLVHRRNPNYGLRKNFELIEYRAVYIDNLLCGISIPLCYYNPTAVFALSIIAYANLITIGGLGLFKRGWFFLPLGVAISYIVGGRVYNFDQNLPLVAASGALLGLHMLSIVYINYFNTSNMNVIKENLRNSLIDLKLEKERSEELLLNILPSNIAQELKDNGEVDPKRHEEVTILFTDFKEFTSRSELYKARDIVKEIHSCFKSFDKICEKYKVEKIKTIGDSYMAAWGLKTQKGNSHSSVVLAALEMMSFIETRIEKKKKEGEIFFEMRSGINTGPVVAGIVGVKKFQYDLWGDTVNTASRMESSGEVGRVNISKTTFELIKDDPQFTFESRGKIEAKGKGEIEMYFVSRSLGEHIH